MSDVVGAVAFALAEADSKSKGLDAREENSPQRRRCRYPSLRIFLATEF